MARKREVKVEPTIVNVQWRRRNARPVIPLTLRRLVRAAMRWRRESVAADLPERVRAEIGGPRGQESLDQFAARIARLAATECIAIILDADECSDCGDELTMCADSISDEFGLPHMERNPER